MTANRTLFSLTAVVVAALLGTACGGDDDDAGSTDAASVQETTWVLTEMSGAPIPEGVEATLQFDGEAIAGSTGCNNYNGAATFEDGTVTVSPAMAMTLMACDGPAAEVETEFVQTIPTASAFVVIEDELRISNDAGEQILVFAPMG